MRQAKGDLPHISHGLIETTTVRVVGRRNSFVDLLSGCGDFVFHDNGIIGVSTYINQVNFCYKIQRVRIFNAVFRVF